MGRDEREQFVSRGKAGRQVRMVRSDGWTKAKREIFHDHFGATCNAGSAARAAGMSEGSAFKLRRRDPEFAALWDSALREADVRLNGKLVVFAETRGKPVPEAEPGEPAVAPLEDFDPELALTLLRHHQGSLAGRPRRAGRRPTCATKAELIAAIKAQLGALKRRREKGAGP